jgi:catechol-2,3-dioxygenase
MLGESDVVATVAVKDMASGKKFYGETLGLKQTDENPGGVTYQSGATKLFIYAAPTGGTNQASSATWHAKDLKATVEELAGKGVKFEHYDMPGVTMDGDIHVMGPNMQAAWFKDPAGNTLAVVQAG